MIILAADRIAEVPQAAPAGFRQPAVILRTVKRIVKLALMWRTSPMAPAWINPCTLSVSGKAVHKGFGDDNMMIVRSSNDCVHLFWREGQGFFAEHVLTCLGSFDAPFGMQVVRKRL